MGILKKLHVTWKSLPLVEKINLAIDIVTGVGCGIGSISIGKRLSEGRNPLERICIKTATAGLSLAAADISAKALKDNYGKPIAAGIERAKNRIAEEKLKEAVSNE